MEKRLYILLLTRYFADNAEREIGPCVWQAGHYDARVAYIDDRWGAHTALPRPASAGFLLHTFALQWLLRKM